MNPLKKLAGETAIYGLSSILGRLLNYLLIPLYTRLFLPSEFGVVTEFYAYVSFLIIVFTYGMETAYFKYSQNDNQENKVFSTAFLSLVFSSGFILLLILFFSQPVASVLRYPDNPEFVSYFAWIMALDAISSIPFARLRLEHKAKTFAFIRLLNIIVNIGFNLFFLVLCPWLIKHGINIPAWLFNPQKGVTYIFVSNLIASALTLVFLLPELRFKLGEFDKVLWKSMLRYAFPLLIAGMAGMVNETIDRILLKFLYPDKSHALEQVGIYGACYKLSIMMTLFIQTFRYAAEPFFFSHAKKENAKGVYADVLKYFVITCSFIFLGIMLFIDFFKYFIGKDFWSGLPVVPILLLANLSLGVFYNLSMWYKLSGHTKYGAYLSVYGAAITLILNWFWIPIWGYMGCAWATLICYSSMAVLSYIIGQKYYPVNYPVKRILLYITTAVLLYVIHSFLIDTLQLNQGLKITSGMILLLLFAGLSFILEKRKFIVP